MPPVFVEQVQYRQIDQGRQQLADEQPLRVGWYFRQRDAAYLFSHGESG